MSAFQSIAVLVVNGFENLFGRLMLLDHRGNRNLHLLRLMLKDSVAVVQKDAAEAFVFVAKHLFELGLTVK